MKKAEQHDPSGCFLIEGELGWGMHEELAAVKYSQLIAWLKFGSVKSIGMKRDGPSFYCSVFWALALVDNGSWFANEDSSFGKTRLD
ncbi:hypothetical protein LguiA_026111 [Lonicera macranthoides]